ncbi:hypothetical protein BAUCODRAFT_501790 [Baudoinia panamericana UAMH 10762]|uniref:Secreted protein n=1 Tax=Baudoinia panamericana (strain UAMH 10762) TaxID=717646 RepID=M2NA56_BAUPA|nr:uncharacterized protein BAUCODRAFT_501790 [Baudoinia panamericana UAMH 10762]EMC95745.1 hypothetical protein BAUCODRAFT_501790 [Baudoinia panamericana UAMH 10762]
MRCMWWSHGTISLSTARSGLAMLVTCSIAPSFRALEGAQNAYLSTLVVQARIMNANGAEVITVAHRVPEEPCPPSHLLPPFILRHLA